MTTIEGCERLAIGRTWVKFMRAGTELERTTGLEPRRRPTFDGSLLCCDLENSIALQSNRCGIVLANVR